MIDLTKERWTPTASFDVRTVDGDKFVASVFGAGEEVKAARGRLIAAAPELLEAVIQCRAVLVTAKSDTAEELAKHEREQVLDRKIALCQAVLDKVAGRAS